MKNNIFYNVPPDKQVSIIYQLPVVEFSQTITTNGEDPKTYERYACNCIVDGERKITTFGRHVYRSLLDAMYSKALTSSACITALVSRSRPNLNNISPKENKIIHDFKFIESSRSVLVFDWDIEEEIKKLHHIDYKTNNKSKMNFGQIVATDYFTNSLGGAKMDTYQSSKGKRFAFIFIGMEDDENPIEPRVALYKMGWIDSFLKHNK